MINSEAMIMIPNQNGSSKDEPKWFQRSSSTISRTTSRTRVSFASLRPRSSSSSAISSPPRDSQGGSPRSGRKPSYADFHPGDRRSTKNAYESDGQDLRAFKLRPYLLLEKHDRVDGISGPSRCHPSHLINTEATIYCYNQDGPSYDGPKWFTEAVRPSAEPLRGPGRAW